MKHINKQNPCKTEVVVYKPDQGSASFRTVNLPVQGSASFRTDNSPVQGTASFRTDNLPVQGTASFRTDNELFELNDLREEITEIENEIIVTLTNELNETKDKYVSLKHKYNEIKQTINELKQTINDLEIENRELKSLKQYNVGFKKYL
jgi:predicted RNase H-like nuclease (RuvC/YqgF family)